MFKNLIKSVFRFILAFIIAVAILYGMIYLCIDSSREAAKLPVRELSYRIHYNDSSYIDRTVQANDYRLEANSGANKLHIFTYEEGSMFAECFHATTEHLQESTTAPIEILSFE